MENMGEICKTCREKFDSGIWLSPQFPDEKVLLFCSEQCKKRYLRMKIERIKVEYPRYYAKVMKIPKKKDVPFWLIDKRQKVL